MPYDRRSSVPALYLLAFCLVTSGCVSESTSTAESASFPDVGVGCEAVRLSADEWRVDCPGEDSAPPPDAVVDQFVQAMDAGVVEDAMTPRPDMAVALPDAGPEPCSPALTLNSPITATSPYDLTRLQASGGTGAWRFALSDNQSGALINATTGVYLAGDTVGTVDRITLTDDGCVGSAEFTMRVVPPMQIIPAAPQVEPGDSLVFEIEGGSGSFALELPINRSGGEVVEQLTYRAGPSVGTDVVRINDTETGESQMVQVTVMRDVVIKVSPQVVFLPMGATGEVTIDGGSGAFDFETGPGLEWDGWRFTGTMPGLYTVRIQDRNAERSAEFTVSVLDSFQADVRPLNDHSLSARIRNAGDLNNDGLDDVVLARAESDAGADNGGAVYVFLSQDGTYGPEPDQSFLGVDRDDELGRGIEVVDLNGDGLKDLMYGVRLADNNGGNSGALMIHLGQPGGLFGEEPSMVIDGPQNDAQFGMSIAVCDFNGDGFQDLAVGSYAYENRDNQPPRWNQGAVVVHLGHEDGLLHEPDQIIPGRMPDENGAWAPIQNMLLGRTITAGDFDGDGLCDLAATSISWQIRGNAGYVFMYKGMAPDGLFLGGLSVAPRTWLTSDPETNQNGEFGRRMTLSDLDGDGRADLVVGHNAADVGGPNSGAIHVFRGQDFPAEFPETPMHSGQADWTVTGTNWDHFGMEVQVMEVNGEPPVDIVATALYDDTENGWDTGQIFVFPGIEGALPASEPSLTVAGPEAAFRLGVVATSVGDSNADGRPDFIATSHYGGTEYPEIGRPFHLVSTLVEPEVDEGAEGEENPDGEEEPVALETYELRPLDLPLVPSSGRFGTDVALVGDVDGDGFGDAFVTMMQAAHPDVGIRSGELWFYRGNADGIARDGERVPAFPGHTAWDFLRGVQGIGDFNGDGHPDFAVLISNDERPRELNETYAFEEPCVPQHNDQGGTYIFLGGPGIFDFNPDFVYWGAAPGELPEVLVGDFDINGDAISDIALGAWRRDREGRGDTGVATLITGRADPHPDRITVICTPSHEHYGTGQGDHLGFALSSVSDLDGDGCDELAVGARLRAEDGRRNMGTVRVMYGFGPTCTSPTPRFIRLLQGDPWIQMGTAIAAGDVDGDGLDDLAIGSPYARHENEGRGGVWVIPGRFLAGITPLPWEDARNAPGQWPDESYGNRFLHGYSQGGEAGRGVFIANGLIGVTEINDFVTDVATVSTVRLYGVSGDGTLDHSPRALVIGETQRPGSRLGEHIGISVGPANQQVLLGASRGSGTSRDNGSAYLLDLSVIPPQAP